MSFKYYVLTSGNIKTLERHFTALKPNETVVIINTLNEEYAEIATRFCVSNSIEHYITESDGTPSTGKNSLLDKFLESDNEYMVQVDGDDYITPYGRNLYRTVALGDSPPDIICLANQLSVQTPQEGFFDMFSKQVDSKSVKKEHFFIPVKHTAHWTHDLTKRSYKKHIPRVNEQEIRKMMRDDIPEDTAREWLSNRKIAEEYALDYGDMMNTLNRLVFYSRKGAEHTRFDPNHKIGEDVLQYYKLKKLSYDGVLDMQVRNERPKYSYLYMQDADSTTRDGTLDLYWIADLIDQLNKIEMYPKGYRLRSFKDPYYEVEQK
jgi:hypothetical protein